MQKNLKNNNIQAMLSSSYFTGQNIFGILRRSTLLVVLSALLLASCKKDDNDEPDEMVAAPTSIRLVHTTVMRDPYFFPGMTPVVTPLDLYVDNAKVTSTSIIFSEASAYFPATSGSKRIEVKNANGVSIIDTVLTIQDRYQYSLFIKDKSWQYAATTTPPAPAYIVPLKRQVVAVVDNNTSPPATGQAKVRFVNMVSVPLNVAEGTYTFYKGAASTVNNIVTVRLGSPVSSNPSEFNSTLASDFAAFDAGPVTFRAVSEGPNSATYTSLDLNATLVAGKLYTVYLVSTEHTVKTTVRSPLSLKILQNID